ncbi:MAG: type II toxin-antitoxin system HigB family toxin [Bacteroidetes bacterium]|nr:type II toxin-antitoxin system HigB family toxin [Fibrella sp.]
MVVIAKSTLTRFAEIHPTAAEPLERWYTLTLRADWATLSDIKQVFNSVDYVGNDRYVFNVKGNAFRIIALIHFSVRTVYIKFVGTHQEYDRIDASSVDI